MTHAAVHELFPDLERDPNVVTSAEIQNTAGISYRQIDYWTRTGYLHSLHRVRETSGFPRVYPREELAVACLVAQLINAEITPAAAFRHARELLDTGTTYIAGFPIHLPDA